MSARTLHLVLLGDSIFDNKSYVGKGNAAVIEQLKSKVQERHGNASLVAVDGNVLSDIGEQLKRVPRDATHLIISIGGNNALRSMYSLENPVKSVGEGLLALSDIKRKFQKDYAAMMDDVQKLQLPVTTCTIYNPRFDHVQQQTMCETGLSLLNDIIVTEATKRGIPVIDLRTIFNDPKDYANPIEPASQGGLKIVRNILHVVDHHRFDDHVCSIYSVCDSSDSKKK